MDLQKESLHILWPLSLEKPHLFGNKHSIPYLCRNYFSAMNDHILKRGKLSSLSTSLRLTQDTYTCLKFNYSKPSNSQETN